MSFRVGDALKATPRGERPSDIHRIFIVLPQCVGYYGGVPNGASPFRVEGPQLVSRALSTFHAHWR